MSARLSYARGMAADAPRRDGSRAPGRPCAGAGVAGPGDRGQAARLHRAPEPRVDRGPGRGGQPAQRLADLPHGARRRRRRVGVRRRPRSRRSCDEPAPGGRPAHPDARPVRVLGPQRPHDPAGRRDPPRRHRRAAGHPGATQAAAGGRGAVRPRAQAPPAAASPPDRTDHRGQRPGHARRRHQRPAPVAGCPVRGARGARAGRCGRVHDDPQPRRARRRSTTST